MTDITHLVVNGCSWTYCQGLDDPKTQGWPALLAKKLGVEVLQGLSNKVEAIEKYLSENELSWASSWYIGNDVNDLDAIRKAKIGICPSDAVKLIKREADHKLKTKGGYGILSEVVSKIEKSI